MQVLAERIEQRGSRIQLQRMPRSVDAQHEIEQRGRLPACAAAIGMEPGIIFLHKGAAGDHGQLEAPAGTHQFR